jgi:thioredoxin-like negative regulator of GroEL
LPLHIRVGAEMANQRVVDSLDRLSALVSQDTKAADDELTRALQRVIDADKAVLKARGKL